MIASVGQSSGVVPALARGTVATRVEEVLARAGLDVLLASSRENLQYLSGVEFFHLDVAPDELAVVVWPRDAAPRLLVPDWTADFARERSCLEVAAWDWRESPIRALTRLLEIAGLAEAAIGLEARHLTAHRFEELRTELPRARLASVDSVLAEVRRLKTPEELALIERAARAADAAVRDAFGRVAAGTTERELAAAIREAALPSGVDEVRWLFLSSGERNHAGGLPQDRRLLPGDLVRVDVGCVVGGYHADIARTAAIAPATHGQREIYRQLWSVHDEAIELFEPGRRVRDVYAAVARGFAHRRLPPLDSYVGHGIGLGIHERPLITDDDGTVLEPGMVLCLEPAVAQPPDVYHVEDVIQVTERGPRVLSRAADWSRLPELGRG